VRIVLLVETYKRTFLTISAPEWFPINTVMDCSTEIATVFVEIAKCGIYLKVGEGTYLSNHN
jgi:hypothetical protein